MINSEKKAEASVGIIELISFTKVKLESISRMKKIGKHKLATNDHKNKITL